MKRFPYRIRDHRWHKWDLWNLVKWTCSHGYTDHRPSECPESEDHYLRRRWWNHLPGGQSAYMFLTDSLPGRIADIKSRWGHCAAADGGKYRRGVPCNCLHCPGSKGAPPGGWPDRPRCRPCDKSPFMNQPIQVSCVDCDWTHIAPPYEALRRYGSHLAAHQLVAQGSDVRDRLNRVAAEMVARKEGR